MDDHEVRGATITDQTAHEAQPVRQSDHAGQLRRVAAQCRT